MTTSAATTARPSDVATGRVPPSPTSTFRPDIQGLRALAVVAVILDHAKLGPFPGGFVGVDVFFVISGFLITQLLLHQAQRTGSISPMDFYSRRARRILPAATVVLVTTVLASVGLLGFVQSTPVIGDSIWSTFFAANVHFSQVGTDYFDADTPASPVQHFWSLAVEEQFYLVWPLLLLLLLGGTSLWRQRRKARRPRIKPRPEGAIPIPAMGALVALGGASLVYSIISTDRDPATAYFSTPARAWELSLGAMCAFLVPALSRLPAWLRTAMAWAGLAAVVVAILRYSSMTPFPGKAALLPVVGTALIIAGGVGSSRFGPHLLLGRKPCCMVGDWSYSLYLWHWPILIIAAGYLQHALTIYETGLLLLLTVVISVLTYHFVENPFRRARIFSMRQIRGVLLYPTAIFITLAACLVAHEAVGQQIAEASSAPPIAIPKPRVSPGATEGSRSGPSPAVLMVRASVAAAEHHDPVPGHLDPPLLDLKGDVADVGTCDYDGTVLNLCPRGDVTGKKSLIVFGDSHARSWIPAIDAIARKEHYLAHYLVKPGCNAALTTPALGRGPFQGCVDWRTWAMGVIESLHPDVLVVASDLPPAIIGPQGQPVTNDVALAKAFQTGLAESMGELHNFVGRIIILGDVPGVDEPPSLCLSARGANLGDCAFPRSARSKLLFDAAHEVATSGGYQFVNTIPWFCAHDLCPSVIGPIVVYRDPEHVTTEYATRLTRPLEAALHLSS